MYYVYTYRIYIQNIHTSYKYKYTCIVWLVSILCNVSFVEARHSVSTFASVLLKGSCSRIFVVRSDHSHSGLLVVDRFTSWLLAFSYSLSLTVHLLDLPKTIGIQD